jgi:hypothetical protein
LDSDARDSPPARTPICLPSRQHSGATGDAFSFAKGARGTLIGFDSRSPRRIVLHSDGCIRANTKSQGTPMKKSLRERLFGPRDVRDSNATALKKESVLAKINEPDLGAKPRARRTVGLTEARLRAANQQSWMTSGKGWSDFLGRFTRPSRS